MSSSALPEESPSGITKPEKELEIVASRQFSSWLLEQKTSLAFSTYQAGKLFLIGIQPDGKLSLFERTFNRCMGLAHANDTLYLSTLYQLWALKNVLEPGQVHQGYDRLYVPQVSYVTGDLDIHDICVDKNGRIVFVSTLFSCLATVSQTHSFIPLWKPKFISKYAAEDRCHMNGLAMVEGEPRYVTCVSQTDVHEGWRDHREKGGVVIDISNDEIIAHGLSMPHSPRYYQDKLWLINSGTGEFGFIDKDSGQFEAVTFCAGYARGLTFIDHFAIVGVSKCRENRTFVGLDLDDKLAQANVNARCGLLVVDLRTGDIVHNLTIDGLISELYDVITLPNVFRPTAIGTKSDEICRMISIGHEQPLKK